MEISPLQRQVKAADVPLEKLAGNNGLSPEEKVAELSRQFEAILLRQILGDTQKPLFASKFNPQSVSSGIYRDMVTTQLADKVSQSGGLGLAQSLRHQLSHELKT